MREKLLKKMETNGCEFRWVWRILITWGWNDGKVWVSFYPDNEHMLFEIKV